MSTISTFSGFTMARLGIMASSKALEVTGNNISNINTPGYTRQKLDQRALYIGGADRYASQFDVRVGAGALTTGVSQLRDPYLDIRYRNEASNVGFYDEKYYVLDQLSYIFDEVAKGEDDNGVLEAQLSRILEQLQNFNTDHAGTQSYENNVRGAAKSLVIFFNNFADRLETLQKDTKNEFTEMMGNINNTLKKIRDLNESIKKAEISSGALSDAERKEGMIGERGQQALELRDERNQLIDELSQYLPIDVTYSDEPIGAGMTVEKLTITLSGTNTVLVDGIYSGSLSVQQVGLDKDGNIVTPPATPDHQGDDPYLRLTISALENKQGEVIASYKNGSKPVNLGDQDLKSGSLQAKREMLTKNGEFSSDYEVNNLGDAKAATKRGIPYYQKALDALANKIAKIFNQSNNFTYDKTKGPDEGVNAFFEADQTTIKAEYADYVKTAGNLFSISGDSDDAGVDSDKITAKNISISNSWSHEKVKIVQTKNVNDMVDVDPNDPTQGKRPASTANTNIAHLVSVMQQKYDFAPKDVDANASSNTVYFTGSFHEMLDYVNGLLGEDTKSTGDILDNYIAAAEELNLGRDSVSGVDLNDEAVNMMQYQKSYSASCRLLTTLDEILDKLINGTGIAGR
jgi:flagellar hook-associated protein 1 FlgK